MYSIDYPDGMPRAARQAYVFQRSNARVRGIEWKFTAASWWTIWEESGKWPERGRKAHQYVMARHGDIGAYEPSNVSIQTSALNRIEGSSRARPNRPKRREGTLGVYRCSDATRTKPWRADYAGKQLGYFLTQEEAQTARSNALMLDERLAQSESGDILRTNSIRHPLSCIA